jgi:hypothetical protein
MNFGQGHTSLGPLLNLQVVTQVPKLPKKCKKDEILGLNVEIFEVSCKNLAAAKMSNKNESYITPPVGLNEKVK